MNILQMEEGYGLLKSGFAMANISDEQMACILDCLSLLFNLNCSVLTVFE
jgi:hypothetical protein